MATADDRLDAIARERPSMSRASATVREVAKTMIDHNCSAVVVNSRDDEVHVVTERDIVKSIANGLDPDDEWAVDVMSTDVRMLEPSDSIKDAARLMQDAVIRHVVVRNPESPDDVALVSIRDLLAPFLESVES